MITRHIAAVFLVTAALGHEVPASQSFEPEEISKCLRAPEASSLTTISDHNPFYLRGDLDGDGKADYAVAVRSPKGGDGVLVCAGNGAVFALGFGIGSKKFSDMRQDRFVAPNWVVYTKRQVGSLAAFRSNVPRPIPVVKGEAIAMIWEDGIALIYWDGKEFRWAAGKE